MKFERTLETTVTKPQCVLAVSVVRETITWYFYNALQNGMTFKLGESLAKYSEAKGDKFESESSENAARRKSK